MNIEHFSHLLNTTLQGTGDSDQHLLTLFSITLQLKAKRILELGVRWGTTTLPFLCAASKLNASVESVDLDPTRFKCPTELQSYWKFYQSDALDFLKQRHSEGAKYDLIYIDDWHSYDHVKKELEYIQDMVSPSSVILLHDLMYYNSQPHYHSEIDTKEDQWANGGPYRAVAELDCSKWEFATIPVNHGLTILRKKTWIKSA